MFFLVRSAVCIGLVVAALPDTPGLGFADGTKAGASAVAALESFCKSNPARCSAALRVLTDDQSPSRPDPGAARKLRTIVPETRT